MHPVAKVTKTYDVKKDFLWKMHICIYLVLIVQEYRRI